MLFNLVWIAGTIGYYSSLVIWIIAQRTHYFHGKYSHSWMIGTLLLIFGTLQIIGSPSDLIVLTGAISLIMPIIVTSIDIDDHRRERRGLFGHRAHCWMEEKSAVSKRHVHTLTVQAAERKDNWSSR